MKNILKRIFVMILVYGILSACNWSFKTNEWNGFSVFILGFIGLVCILDALDEIT